MAKYGVFPPLKGVRGMNTAWKNVKKSSPLPPSKEETYLLYTKS